MKPAFDKQAYIKQYRIDHREELRAYSLAYDADHRKERRDSAAAYAVDHKDEKRVYDAAYNASHKEERRAYYAAYHADHREETLAYRAAHYQENRDAILEKQRQKQAEFTEWLQILRTVNGCDDCGAHEGRLHHHHADPSTRRFTVSAMYNRSLDTLEDELEKCVVLCPPCHSRRHVQMRAA